MRDELLASNTFDSLLEAQVLVADWREEDNTHRPHSAPGMNTPAEFAQRWRTNNQPQLSCRLDHPTGSEHPTDTRTGADDRAL